MLYDFSSWSNPTFTPVYGTYGSPSDYEIKEEDGIYHPVTGIEKDAFKNSTVQFLTLSSSINTFKAESLSYATILKEIVLTEKATCLGGYGFSDCSNAKEIVLPSSLSSTGF